MGKLIILRHGATKGNKGQGKHSEVMRGVSKMSLDRNGRDEAERAGKFLKGKGEDVQAIFCSDIPRAKETASILQRELGKDIEIKVVKDMRTWDPGILQGKKLEDVQGAVTYFETHPGVQVPGGQKIADWLKQEERAEGKLTDAAKDQTIVAVWHSRPILVLMTKQKGEDAEKFHKHWEEVPAPGSILEGEVKVGKLGKVKMVKGKMQKDRRS